MTWPYWFVIGLVLLAMIVTISYIAWIRSIAEYVEFHIPNDAIAPIACIYVEDPVTHTMSMGGYIILYRDANLQAPWQLEDKLSEKLTLVTNGKETNFENVDVTKEPGYNSYRIYYKNKELLQHAIKSWSSSIFHALVMPIELLLRISLFPLWTMIDFVSHERRLIAGVIAFPNLRDRPATLACLKDNISIIEAYNSVYVKFSDSLSYKIIPYEQ